MSIIKENVVIHDVLNPLIWNSDETLLPEVESKVIEIVNLFRDSLEIPIDIVDVHIVGSNASYNYTEFSDLDVHVIVNYEFIDASHDVLQALYNAEKSSFNSTYDIHIHGINVEIYVEDVSSSAMSNGVYSVPSKKWIKKPIKLNNINVSINNSTVELWKSRIDDAILNKTLDYLKSLVDRLYVIRKNSLISDGEFGKGNLLFKELRNNGYLTKLKDAIHSEQSKQMSLEDIDMKSMLLRKMSELEE